MPEITRITPQKRDQTRCNIEVDGKYYCGLSLETVMRFRLKAGASIDEEELQRIQLDSEKGAALDKALTHISVSGKTEKEIRTFLQKKGYLQDVSDYVVEKMKEYRYLDDEAYARAYAESAKKKKGKRLIAAELKRKGISDSAAEAALSGCEGEAESALKILEKYLRTKPVDEKTLRKAYAHLIQKGFDYDIAREALRAYGETSED